MGTTHEITQQVIQERRFVVQRREPSRWAKSPAGTMRGGGSVPVATCLDHGTTVGAPSMSWREK